MKRQMTYWHRRLTIALFLAAALGIGVAFAQTGGGYDLTWSTIDGGGGGTSGGGYQLTSTLGQPDAGALSGGIYSLSGGFWGNTAGGNTIYLPLILR